MALTTSDISKLFTLYTPGYTCAASKAPDGTYSLQFTNTASLDVITLPGFTEEELSSAPVIKRLSKVLFEEFVVSLATRAGPSRGFTKH